LLHHSGESATRRTHSRESSRGATISPLSIGHLAPPVS
jgi:hypothetical protein